ncbi:MAG: cellulose synthase family protein [Dehalococcoidia bacterium]|jgi:cellulose synthase/poly-beta-1,6-N-acetylglucosamine synthase-like glycosyltransferase
MTNIPIWMVIVFAVYAVPLLFIFLYSLTQVNLVYRCFRHRKNAPPDSQNEAARSFNGDILPLVTVQLPVFNELYVVERLIDAVSVFDYPADRLEIQVLDDSTDETYDLAEAKCQALRARGLDISHVRRSDRTGFKAGALAHGLSLAKGEFIAIFDADFLPPPDFLMSTIPHFKDPRIGVVQTKWEHVNEDYSLLTHLQAFGLDAHFNVEQQGRYAGGYFINFNGTGGVWRRACILNAGNWHSDTLTEDLDLSYRAQVRGWKFKYLEKVGTPAELPVTMSALKTQQFRWTKGAAECARKNLPAVFHSSQISALTKIHAFFHLTNSTVFPCILISSLLSIPFLFIKNSYPQYAGIYLYASFSLLSLIALGFFFRASRGSGKAVSFSSFLKDFLMFLSFSMGFSLHNTVAVIEGYAGKKIPFIRTPKYNIHSSADSWKGKKYLVDSTDIITVLEFLLSLYFLSGVIFAFYLREYALLPFHIMLALGFGTVAGYSIWQSRLIQK